MGLSAVPVHHFTWCGEFISSHALAMKLGIGLTTLYAKTKLAGSDRGEDIAKICAIPRKEQKRTTIEWGDGTATIDDVANELGIKKATLQTRMTRYGIDCCQTYFPGVLPNTPGLGGGNKEWGKLGSMPRNNNLAKIGSLGTWEARQ